MIAAFGIVFWAERDLCPAAAALEIPTWVTALDGSPTLQAQGALAPRRDDLLERLKTTQCVPRAQIRVTR